MYVVLSRSTRKPYVQKEEGEEKKPAMYFKYQSAYGVSGARLQIICPYISICMNLYNGGEIEGTVGCGGGGFT